MQTKSPNVSYVTPGNRSPFLVVGVGQKHSMKPVNPQHAFLMSRTSRSDMNFAWAAPFLIELIMMTNLQNHYWLLWSITPGHVRIANNPWLLPRKPRQPPITAEVWLTRSYLPSVPLTAQHCYKRRSQVIRCKQADPDTVASTKSD